MRTLQWLLKSQVDTIDNLILRVANKELVDRHWGGLHGGTSSGGARKLFINDPRGIAMVAGLLRYHLDKFNTSIYYRGQKKDWHLTPALFRSITLKKERILRENVFFDAFGRIGPHFDPKGSDDEREALSQHYGMKTRWLDIVDNIQSAAWFACHEGREEGQDGSAGYLYLMAVPNDSTGHCRVIDLRKKPSQWLRPHIQQAFALRAENPHSNFGRLHQFHLLTMVVPQYVLHQWSCRGYITQDVFFPNADQDAGARFWQRAKVHLATDPKFDFLYN